MQPYLAIFLGLAIGAVGWPALKHKVDFDTVVAGITLGVSVALGMYALIAGEISLGGRNGIELRRYSGWSVRAIGLAWASITLFLAFWELQAV